MLILTKDMFIMVIIHKFRNLAILSNFKLFRLIFSIYIFLFIILEYRKNSQWVKVALSITDTYLQSNFCLKIWSKIYFIAVRFNMIKSEGSTFILL